MKLGFVRHGQTQWNLEGRLQGSSDIPLNDTGRTQASEAVSVLAGGNWDVIVSSPLSRARETAQIIADGLGLELGPSYDLLIERDYAQGEGMVEAEALELWPDKLGGGIEPLDSVVDRGLRAINQIAADYPGKNVAIICHGTIIRYTLSHLAGYKLDTIRNGSVAIVGQGQTGAWELELVNDAVPEKLVR
ncbi:histidine phosphatase family protein [Glutamicibacter sp. M10]|uniref:histidine phosphatase family protein n=1 Tax=Glutamicibacter sp. M10 TaxID=3023076 RepID=UPI0021C7D14B|nr:histidine phosphatase family protein [Glutamicibacter sp. M10]UXN32100.1 histidine phosphatase family protein [Glutamicibacter sp. M10]